MIKLVILIPVLRRPQNLVPLVESIRESTKGDYELLFIASPGDTEEIKELEAQNQNFGVLNANFQGNGDYARKINAGFKSTEAEWYFLGADDLEFHFGWFERAMNTYKMTKACVIGTNDLGNPYVMNGQHSTHSLVRRDYILECGGSINEPGKILHEGYRHNYVDTELVSTAISRGAWAFSRDSIVAHKHPDWGHGPRDEVYDLGKRYFYVDAQYHETRKYLWS